MRMFLAAAAATMFATAAFAADPVAPPAPAPAKSTETMPASTATSATCAQLITQARGMTLPSDATKAKQVKDDLAAADASRDDATCKTHANAALDLLSGGM